ncbi:MAG: HIT domain-containing protein [Candidatus Wolfebacteria bacterium]|nr:HIT domain-containing protein [Candidatus Wolfebacteria bacterium]
MLYKELLKHMRKCPFCTDGNRIIKQNKFAFLTYALAPYSSHHLLVIPKRHVFSINELNKKEEKSVSDLLEIGTRLIHEYGDKNCTVLVRDGHNNKMKSIDHLHYHIIPNHRIGDFDSKGKKRRILEEKEIDRIMKDMKSCLESIGK